jgi:hypothetical protein
VRTLGRLSLAETLYALGSFDHGCGEFVDAGVFALDVEDLAAVVHDDVPVAHLVGVVEVVGN